MNDPTKALRLGVPCTHPSRPFMSTVYQCRVCGEQVQGSATLSAVTDEELSAWEPLHQRRMSGIGEGNCVYCRDKWPCSESRLIAALRACRVEVERLTHG